MLNWFSSSLFPLKEPLHFKISETVEKAGLHPISIFCGYVLATNLKYIIKK